MKLNNNKSGFVLIISIVFLIFLSVFLMSALLRNNMELEYSQNRLEAQQAFYAAESGLQEAEYQIRLNNSLWIPQVDSTNAIVAATKAPVLTDQTNPASAIGYYSVSVKNAPLWSNFNSVWVISTGTDLMGKVSRSILAQIIYINPADFLISTGGNLHIGSGTTINSNVLAQNVYFDVNSSLPPAQQQITVNGTVDYLSSVNGNTNPSVVINGNPQTTLYPTITFAGVDTANFSALANPQSGGNGLYVDGDYTYSGNIDPTDLKANNGLVFATGNIYISGTIQSSMLFVAGGSIYIEGNITPVSGQAVTPQLGLLAEQDVFVDSNAPSNVSINAFVMANGGPDSKGNPDPLGGVFKALPAEGGGLYSKQEIDFTGSMALQGAGGARSAADFNVYNVRNYTYNPALGTSAQIPFLPFIANIVSWQEPNPYAAKTGDGFPS